MSNSSATMSSSLTGTTASIGSSKRRPWRKAAFLCSWTIICLCTAASISMCEGFSPFTRTRGTFDGRTIRRAPCSRVPQQLLNSELSMSSREQEPTSRRRQTTNPINRGEQDIMDRDGNNPLIGPENYENTRNKGKNGSLEPDSFIQAEPAWWKELNQQFESMVPWGSKFKLPPFQVDDFSLLGYDIFLLLNLVVSISFWVVHRLQLEYVALAFNEGCLLSILWIAAGLYHGAFLHSAVEGHQRPLQERQYSCRIDNEDENNLQQQQQQQQPPEEQKWWNTSNKGGPSGAALLALNTYINTMSLRLIVALVVAVVQHRPVFDDPLEQLIPYEVAFGLMLMPLFRSIHSAVTPRI